MPERDVSGNRGEGAVAFKRALGLREAVTITVGTVIGVGLFTTGANSVGYLGPLTLVATFVAFLISLLPALIYAEMGAALPYAGGTYRYAREGLGGVWGMLAGWNFVISLIAVASGEGLAFSFYLKTLTEALGFPLMVDERIIAAAIILVGFGLVAFYMPTIMLAVGAYSPWAAAVIAVASLAVFLSAGRQAVMSPQE